MRAGLIRSEIRWINQVKVEALPILLGSKALSWKLIFCNKLIVKTDVLCQSDSQTARAQQSFLIISILSLSSVEQRRRTTWQSIIVKSLEIRTFQRRKQAIFTLTLLMMEVSKRAQFKSLIPEEVSLHPKILSQPNLQDINRLNQTISVIVASEFEKTPVTNFTPI